MVCREGFRHFWVALGAGFSFGVCKVQISICSCAFGFPDALVVGHVGGAKSERCLGGVSGWIC